MEELFKKHWCPDMDVYFTGRLSLEPSKEEHDVRPSHSMTIVIEHGRGHYADYPVVGHVMRCGSYRIVAMQAWWYSLRFKYDYGWPRTFKEGCRYLWERHLDLSACAPMSGYEYQITDLDKVIDQLQNEDGEQSTRKEFEEALSRQRVMVI